MTLVELARKLRPYIEKAVENLPDDDAVESKELFEGWKPGSEYKPPKRLKYNGKLYRVEQAHVSQADWTPDKMPALYTEVTPPGEIGVWRQPTGAQDAYNKGDKVHFPGKTDPVYISTSNNNVWAPNVYGWELFNK